MSGPLKTILVELDRPRQMRLSNGATKRLMAVMGQDAMNTDLAKMDELKASPEGIVKLLDMAGKMTWALCAGEDPNLTLEQVNEELIGPDNYEYVLGKVMECFGEQAPVAEPGERQDPTPATRAQRRSRAGRSRG